jgi:hypothetical protein
MSWENPEGLFRVEGEELKLFHEVHGRNRANLRPEDRLERQFSPEAALLLASRLGNYMDDITDPARYKAALEMQKRAHAYLIPLLTDIPPLTDMRQELLQEATEGPQSSSQNEADPSSRLPIAV